MKDTIYRADAIKAVKDAYVMDAIYEVISEDIIKALSALPSADAKGDLISREEAIAIMTGALEQIEETEGIAIVDKVAYRTLEDYAEEAFSTATSAEAVQGEWIPCSERLPEDLEAVNVTWVNHNPPVYYQYTKDVPNADTAVYYRGVWYWWDSTICDVLGEYGEECGAEPIDKYIEITAWTPLQKPYKGGDSE